MVTKSVDHIDPLFPATPSLLIFVAKVFQPWSPNQMCPESFGCFCDLSCPLPEPGSGFHQKWWGEAVAWRSSQLRTCHIFEAITVFWPHMALRLWGTTTSRGMTSLQKGSQRPARAGNSWQTSEIIRTSFGWSHYVPHYMIALFH